MGFVTARSRARVYRFVLALVEDPRVAERLTLALLAQGVSDDLRSAIWLCRRHCGADGTPFDPEPHGSLLGAAESARSRAAQRRAFDALARTPVPPSLLPAWQRKFHASAASPPVDVPSS
jgi:hypothetical protein